MAVTAKPWQGTFTIRDNHCSQRLDHFLVRTLDDCSRAQIGKLIRSGHIRVNTHCVKPGYKLKKNDHIAVEIPVAPAASFAPQSVYFKVIYEDEHLAVISKPPGLVVHPAAGHLDGTLVNGLLHRYATLPGMEDNRPGIVHRLDKDTSGIMLVARTESVRRKLAAAFKNRLICKSYRAILLRSPSELTGKIVAPIGRHPVKRKKMAIRPDHGRYAATRWKIIQAFTNGLCLAEIYIETGRTHQIRVHMSSLGAAVAGDPLYGGKVAAAAGVQPERQLLHAATLGFTHPVTDEKCRFSAPLWDDMQQVLDLLRREYTCEG